MTEYQKKRYAVIGNPIEHSRSPFIHEQFALQMGITLQYDKILAGSDDFSAIVEDFFAGGGAGLNITVPFKERACTLASADLSERARRATAVNTLWIDQGRLHGCNTDGIGFLNDLKRLDVDVHGKNILLIGAGGAAKGLVFPLLQAGCARVHIANRTAGRALDLCQNAARSMPSFATQLSAGGLDQISGRWDLVINATSSSLGQDAPDLIDGLYAADALAYDLMYAAAPTPFMRQALRQGAQRAVDGLGMLVGQAAVSFAIWHGQQPDTEAVLALLRQRIGDD